ncbi:MAG: hypothetical protein BMS9Abin39_0703 [Ignavibacteria bacterium]|nr:MAG: hypothetical protein BMS9Abin39_0703 [Ignavibacteria bacterium]
MILKFFTFGVLILFSFSCSSSKQNTNEESSDNGVYVFDEVPAEDAYQFDKPEEKLNYFYFIQIGAFSSLKRAETFATKSTKILNEELDVKFSERTKLYVVTINKKFSNRLEAEKIRNELWQNELFNDAWILKEIK